MQDSGCRVQGSGCRVHQRGEVAEAALEGFADRREGQHDVQIALHPLQSERESVCVRERARGHGHERDSASETARASEREGKRRGERRARESERERERAREGERGGALPGRSARTCWASST